MRYPGADGRLAGRQPQQRITQTGMVPTNSCVKKASPMVFIQRAHLAQRVSRGFNEYARTLVGHPPTFAVDHVFCRIPRSRPGPTRDLKRCEVLRNTGPIMLAVLNRARPVQRP